jgi:Gpi18-like mannosyltransferase
LRAAFYLLIYPAGMFLAVIYTEGLFLGLSFGALAMARRRKWIWAALLAACATWTRASGGLLLLPLAYYWWKDGGLDNLVDDLTWGEVGKALLVASPVWAYLAWQALLGQRFHIVEDRFFSRGLLAIPQTIGAWTFALRDALSGKHSEMAAYYLVEVVAILFAFTVCALSWKRDRILALYSLATIFFSLTSGVAQGMHRYVMAAPVIFLLPACWGKHEAFDRTWTLGCALLMGIFAIMFGYDFWAG